jgi:putative zinc finger/helix-turn-helix YgiT family protein
MDIDMSEIVCPDCGKSQETFRGDYRYLESGLDNVIICDIELIKCSCGQESALIPKILAVHKAIANGLLEKETQLTGKEIRFLRKEMGLKGRDFADLVSVDNATLSRWENGKTKPSVKADRLIRVLYAIKMKSTKELASITFKAISRGQSEIVIYVMITKEKILAFHEGIYEWIRPATLRASLRLPEPMMMMINESTCFEEIAAADNYGYALAA